MITSDPDAAFISSQGESGKQLSPLKRMRSSSPNAKFIISARTQPIDQLSAVNPYSRY